jgi:hypothetical protein
MDFINENWGKYPPEYFLQLQVVKKLNNISTQESRLEELRITVEKQLLQFKKEFDRNHPKNQRVKDKNIEKKTSNYEEQLNQKFLNINFRKYILGRGKLEKCLIPDLETTEGFLNRDYTSHKKYNKVSKTLDFFSVYTNFEGFKDGLKHKFDTELKTTTNLSLNKANARIEKTVETFINSSGIDIIDIINFSNKTHKNNLQQLNINKPHEFINDIFDTIINSNELPQAILISADFLFEHKSRWWQRAILASALTLSIINFWDIEKVKLLKRLAELEHEPLVSERAIIGITIALIKSNKEKKNFIQTVHLLTPLKKSKKFSSGIYETLEFLYDTKNTIKLEKAKYDDVYNHLHIEYLFNYFEPPHREAKYISQELFFNSREEEDSFFKTINTAYLNSQLKEKSCVILTEDKNIKDKKPFYNISEVVSSVKEKYDTNKEFVKKYPYQFYKISMESMLIELMFHLTFTHDFNLYLNSLNALISNTKRISIYTDIFNHFPHHRYITILPASQVLDKTLKFDNRIYFDTGYIISLKGIDDVALDFIKKGQELQKRELETKEELEPLITKLQGMNNL